MIFVVLVIFAAIAVWFFIVKSKSVDNSLNSLIPTSSPYPTPTPTPTPEASEIPKDKILVQDLVVGTGKEAKSGDMIKVNYLGTFLDGEKFDSSYDRGQPFEFTLGAGQVIRGWDIGVVGMRVGGKRKLVIPPAFGYGDKTVGPIPANSTLVFEVELLDVQNSK